jgi:hypothetical protein
MGDKRGVVGVGVVREEVVRGVERGRERWEGRERGIMCACACVCMYLQVEVRSSEREIEREREKEWDGEWGEREEERWKKRERESTNRRALSLFRYTANLSSLHQAPTCSGG